MRHFQHTRRLWCQMMAIQMVYWSVLWMWFEMVRRLKIEWLLSLNCDNYTSPMAFHNRTHIEEGVVEELELELEPQQTKIIYARNAKKPQWVNDKIIELKAKNIRLSYRKIAELFNRLYFEKTQMSVGHTFVNKIIKLHRYEIEVLHKKIKNRRPVKVKNNLCWGIDLTYVATAQKESLPILGMIDYGSRRCVSLQLLSSKHSFVLIQELLKAIIKYGKPKSIKTDNEPVFTSLLFILFLFFMNIRHQKSDVAAPWQNGRIERFFGTFKEKIKTIVIKNPIIVPELLYDFQFWYNCVRSHTYLDGKTPNEVWHGVDVFTQGYKRAIWYEKWGGLLTGYYLKT
jgi:putative transposase